ncbi:type II secretion system protein [Dyella nitratireducens]|uniref:Uncharacterized protein n=1 Tax=Dyella nitratireducens TaxID=1849580 RepID=A0ABQ1GHV1_9GAMM|nr:type II secretion system protein [Dyella nitratireducens]GGA44100.1 hypothetical protein GCM10010981_36560 [Dyella nitratireducens]GLQ41787.1 hypothetical protein GCM10007902_16370 [Dyella nitratireducens]
MYFSRKPRSQRGDVLLEALISVLVMGFIGAGTAYAVGRMTVSAKNTRVDGVAASQMRLLLQQYGSTLCPGQANNAQAKITLPLTNTSYPVQVQCLPGSSITVGGIAVTQPSSVVLCIPQSNTAFDGSIVVGTDASAIATGVTACATKQS